jgi:hypothetical protein
MFDVGQLETSQVGKCFHCFDEGYSMLVAILDLFGQIPFEFHMG